MSGSLVRRAISPRIIKVIAAAVIGCALLHFALYLYVPNFADYGEPVIPLLASNFLHHGPVYADWNAGKAVIGSNYGPYIFLSQIPVLIIFPGIIGSKLIGIIFAVLALLLLCLVLRSYIVPLENVLTFCALMIALLAFFLHSWFWNRPDSLLIAIVSLGVFIVDRARPSIGLILIGLLAGIAANLKLFAPIYLIPLALASFQQMRGWPEIVWAVVVGGVMFGIALGFPFAIGVSSLEPYISNMLVMRHQGFVASAVVQSVLYGIVLSALPLLIWPYHGTQRIERVMILALLGCAAAVAVIAGKPGGGPGYMMPFVPLSLYISVKMLSREPKKQRVEAAELFRLTFCVVLICALPLWAYSWLQMARQLEDHHTELEKSAELREFFRVYPNSQMGHSSAADSDQQAGEFYRVEKAFLGQVSVFDVVNYADQRRAGIPATVMYPLLENCDVPNWILLRQAKPFSGEEYDVPLFDQGVVERFRTHYKRVTEGKYYEVWTCR